MLLDLTDFSEQPLYQQLTNQLGERIVKGELSGGTELPLAGEMARRLRVSRNTVRRAYVELEKEGLLRRREQDGAIVTSNLSRGTRAPVFRNSSDSSITSGSEASSLSTLLERRDLDDQLMKAHQLQSNLLPKDLPENGRFAMAVHWIPSHSVGGDFYDYLPLGENRFGLVIADACGSGLPAALLISQAQAMLKSEINNGNDIQRTLENMNRQIFRFAPRDKFVTLFYGEMNTATGEFLFANAGHNYPVLMRTDGQYQFLRTGGLALGMFEEATYETERVALADCDTLFLFTDGLTEAMNNSYQQYGEDRLVKILHRNRNTSARDILDIVVSDVDRFCGTETSRDDQTILVLKMKELKEKNISQSIHNS